MRPASAEDVSELSDLLFSAVYDDREWGAAAGKLKQIMNTSSAAIGLLDTTTYESTVLYGDCSESYARLVFAPEIGNPIGPALGGMRVGEVTSDRVLMEAQELQRSTFFNEWLRPQGEKGFMTAKTSGGQIAGMVGTNRGMGQPDIDEADIRQLRRLAPMLTRATRLRVRVGALRLGERASTYDRMRIGMVIADAQARLLYVNETADAILSAPESGLDARRGVLEAGRLTLTLRRLIAEAAAKSDGRQGLGGYLAVPAADGMRRSLAVTVAPMPDAGRYGLATVRAATVFIQPFEADLPSDFQARMMMLFGLTKREAEIAAALASGLSMQDAAETYRVSIHTARSHLAQLFAKTGTRQQSQLAAQLARLASPDTPPWRR